MRKGITQVWCGEPIYGMTARYRSSPLAGSSYAEKFKEEFRKQAPHLGAASAKITQGIEPLLGETFVDEQPLCEHFLTAGHIERFKKLRKELKWFKSFIVGM
jgi:hypothetical protein